MSSRLVTIFVIVNYKINTKMETEYVLEIDEITPCRICYSPKAVYNVLTDYLGEEGVLLHEALEFIACLKVEPDDVVSNYLCVSCLNRLLDAYKFKNQILDSYRPLDDNSCKTNSSKKSEFIYTLKLSQESVTNMKNIDAPESPKSRTDEGIDADAVEFLSQHYGKEESSTLQSHQDNNESIVEDLANSAIKKQGSYECQLCGKSFRFRSNYIDHIRLHANVKKFACTYCGKAFVQIGNYRTHLRIHTKERPYCCPHCQKSFNQSSALNVHLRIHNQERNYSCNTCGKGFKTTSDLYKHKKIHDPILQFICQFCEKTFAQKANLKRHQKLHHMHG